MAKTANAFAVPEQVHEPIKCRECGQEAHSLLSHLPSAHGMTLAQYQAKYKGAPVLSELGEQMAATISGEGAMPRQFTTSTVQSMATFGGVGFGKNGLKDNPIKSYVGFTAEDGVPEINENYRFQKDVTRDFLMGLIAKANIYLHGPTGSGKTSLPEQVAARLGRPFYCQQFYQEMETIEINGTFILGEGGTMPYLYSGLARAMQLPSIICLDEYDSGNPALTAICNGLLDGKDLVLGAKGGERIKKHQDCIFVGTGNTNGQGDETGLYTSTTVQSFATMNRFKMFLQINYMKPEDEIALLTAIYGGGAKPMPDAEIKDMIKLANLIRDGFLGGTITAVLSTRQVLNWAQWLAMTGDCGRAFSLAFTNQLGATDKSVCEGLFQKVYGTAI